MQLKEHSTQPIQRIKTKQGTVTPLKGKRTQLLHIQNGGVNSRRDFLTVNNPITKNSDMEPNKKVKVKS